MLKVVIDPGHGGKDPGAVHGKNYEKVFNLQIAAETARQLNNSYDAAVYITRISDIYVGLNERAEYANDIKADYFISMHINAGGGTGFESYIYTNAGSSSHAYRDVLHDHVANYFKAKGFPDRGKKKANFAVLRETSMPAILLENLFLDNSADLSFLTDYQLIRELGQVIAAGIARALKLRPRADDTGVVPARMPTAAEASRARQLLQSKNPSAPDYIDIYVQMGELYRIRWDAVFAQSCKETAYWKFGGDVLPHQNNFAGLGAFDGKKGASFATPEDGIEAQFQHWHAYYYGGQLPAGRPLLDPRRDAVLSSGQGGALHFVEDLGGRWAPGRDYGVSIVKDYMAKFTDVSAPAPLPTPTPTPTQPPQEPPAPPSSPGDGSGWNPQAEIDRLRRDGLVVNEHDPKDPVTWGQFATVLNRLRDRLSSGGSQNGSTSPGGSDPGGDSPGQEPPAAPGAAELLQNGDFSRGSQGWKGTAVKTNSESNGNKYGVNQYNWNFYQDFAVSPGAKLVFNGRTRNGGNPNDARVVIGFFNPKGTLKAVADIKYTHTGSGWEQFPRQMLNAPSYASTGRIYLLTNGGSAIHHFDDISIVEVE